MDETQANLRIAELRQQIHRHDYLYYVSGATEISDQDYDRLYAELNHLETQFPHLLSPDSPTQRVGGQPSKEFASVTHNPPMLSLGKTHNLTELRKFYDMVMATADGQAVTFSVEHKIDGLSVKLDYQNGRLFQAALRGNGDVGDDVTANIKTIGSIPLVLNPQNTAGLPVPARLEVRGEIYMPVADFQKLNAARQSTDEESFANPRAAASGSMRQLDPRIVATRPLAGIFYLALNQEGLPLYQTHSENIQMLASFGFQVVQPEICSSFEDLEAAIAGIQSVQKSLPYDIDGIVIKVNNLVLWNTLGATAHHPRYAIAYKYSHDQAETLIRTITVQVGRTGVLTPVAELEPVMIGGARVTRATLYNEEIIRQKDIRIGDTVMAERGGDVIPQVAEVIFEKRLPDSKPFNLYEHVGGKCPECGGQIRRDPEFVAWRCENISCPAQLKRTISHFAKRNAMDIDGLGDVLVGQLVENSLVKDVADLYTLTIESLTPLERVGDKSAQNLLDAIRISRDQELGRLIHAIGIRGVGETMAETLARKFTSLDNLMKASLEELQRIGNIGSEKARNIDDFFHNAANLQVIEKLRLAKVNFVLKDSEIPQAAVNGSIFYGKTCVITGALNDMSREEAERRIVTLGGRITKTVSSKTDFLICGEDPGAKLDKARELGTSILMDKDFRKALEIEPAMQAKGA